MEGEINTVKREIFGINMNHYCRDHEEAVRLAMEENKITPGLISLHREKISILQHERLIHLIVTVMVVIIELFAVDLVLLHPDLVGILGAVIMLGLAVLLGLYFCHYFFLENTVQYWYKLLNDMEKAIQPQE